MKETKIAKDNIEKINIVLQSGKPQGDTRSKTHKQTCQRWLEFLGEIHHLIDCMTSKKAYQEYHDGCFERTGEKIVDLKQAIKTYEDAGI